MKRKSEIEIGARMCAEIRRIFPDESLRGIARVLGCNKNAINAWENGSVPSAMFLARIHSLGGDVIWILTGERGGERKRPARSIAPSSAIDPKGDRFGTILNCAVRYALGRRTYMPSLVIGFITPLLPELSSKTVWCFDQDVTDAKYTGGYGDACDEQDWMRFHEAVKSERRRRGEPLYKSHREE